MKISYQWLSEQLKAKKMPTPQSIAKELSLKTVEVENVVDQGAFLHDVVVGEILEIKKHPDADKLSVAQVDVGEKKPRQIIFGQMVQMQVGFKIPVALAPTVLPGNKEIKKVNLRGVMSEGMLCLDQELGLLKDGVSIQFFGPGVKNGTQIKKALGLDDTILEIDNKSLSNRPDLFGHYGIAREVSAIFGVPLRPYNPPKIREGVDTRLSVKVQDKKLCPRYTAVVVDGVNVTASPLWLQNRLRAVGLRPINNIVDITNYVMYEFGQPMHAFDAKQLTTSNEQVTIFVRKAKDREKMKALDDKEYALTNDMLVIADTGKPIAIAGVIGGAESAITEKTASIIFESANFNAVNIRKTAAALGIRTDSSTRFEKYLDPAQTESALERAVELVRQLCLDARVVSKVIDVGSYRLNQGPIIISEDFVKERVGVKIPKKAITKYLRGLGFIVKEKGKKIVVTVPTWRATKDISIAEDLVEEIIRLYGYENIPSTFPVFSINPPMQLPLRKLERRIKELLAYEFDYTEVYNYSFESLEWLKKLGEDVGKHLELDNPVAKDRPLIRRTVLSNMLVNVETNLHRYDCVKLFEIGRTFHTEETGEKVEPKKNERLPKQDTMLGIVYAEKGREVPFFETSGAIRSVFARLGLSVDFFKVTPERLFHPGRYAQIQVQGKQVGVIGELNTRVQERIGIPHRVAMVEITLNALMSFFQEYSNYQPLSAYPGVERDIAFVVERSVAHTEIVQTLAGIDPLIVSVELFDVYEGERVEKQKKSMAYHIVYRSKARTLAANEIDTIHAKVIKILEQKFQAEIRK